MTQAPAEPAAPEAGRGPEPLACPRCGAAVAGDQAWCTECGLAARTRLVPTPGWRAPLVAAALVGLAAIVALIVAFVVLTGDNAPVPATTATATPAPAPVVPPAPTTAPATTATTPTTQPPAATVPPATTTIPPATVPGQTVPPTPTTTAPTGAE